MDFSDALREIINGKHLARSGWNGRGMYVRLHKPPTDLDLDYLILRTASGESVPWVISNSDALTDDWSIVP